MPMTLLATCAALMAAASPSPPSYLPLDPSRVECSAFRPADDALCYQTASDLHQLFELILGQLEADDTEKAIQETLPTTPQMFPDGTVPLGPQSRHAVWDADRARPSNQRRLPGASASLVVGVN